MRDADVVLPVLVFARLSDAWREGRGAAQLPGVGQLWPLSDGTRLSG